MKTLLNQVTSIELLDDNKETFNDLLDKIKNGASAEVVDEMDSWWHSDRDIMTYKDILRSAEELNERIVFDNYDYLLTASNNIITLYQYKPVEDMLGDSLEVGDEVLWADPDDDARDLNRTWVVYEIQSEEVIKIYANDASGSEAEVPPSELVHKATILHIEVL